MIHWKIKSFNQWFVNMQISTSCHLLSLLFFCGNICICLKISYCKWVYSFFHYTPAFSQQWISLSHVHSNICNYAIQNPMNQHSLLFILVWGPAFTQSNCSFHQRWRYSWSPSSSPPSRSSLPAGPEVAQEVVQEVVQRDPSAMMDLDQPALMGQHQPVTMAQPLSLTETCNDDLFSKAL